MKNEHKILHENFVKFGSIYEYAAKLAGLSRNQVNEALRILAKIEDKPSLQKVVEEKGIGAVRPIVNIATIETAEFWAEKATIMSKNTLETYVSDLRKQDQIDLPRTAESTGIQQEHAILNFGNAIHSHEKQAILNFNNTTHSVVNSGIDAQKNPPPKKVIAMELDQETLQQLEKLKGCANWNDLMKQLLALRQIQLEGQKTQAVATESRHIPIKNKRHITARTNGICAYPNCLKPQQIFHHTQRYSLGKIHDPERLHGLCKSHERLAHLGLIENEEQNSQNWLMRLQPDKNLPKYKIDQLVMKYR